MTDPPTQPAAFRRVVEMILLVLAAIGAVAVVVQIGFAGFGAFGGDFGLHKSLGYGIAGLAAVILVVALLSWPGLRIVLIALLLLLLTVAGQIGFAELGEMGNPWFGAAHAIDGALVLATMIWLLASLFLRQRARR